MLYAVLALHAHSAHPKLLQVFLYRLIVDVVSEFLMSLIRQGNGGGEFNANRVQLVAVHMQS